jgi:hypothetical protein
LFATSVISNNKTDVITETATMGGMEQASFGNWANFGLQSEQIGSGKVITKVGPTWAESGRENDRLRGILLTYSDGSTQVLGRNQDSWTYQDTLTFDYDNGERITKVDLRLIGSNGDLPHSIVIYTNKDRSITLGPPAHPGGYTRIINPDVGSGILLGMYGSNSGDNVNIDHIGLYLLRSLSNVASFYIKDLNYDLQYLTQPTLKSLYDAVIPNPTSQPTNSTITREQSHANHGSWTNTEGHTFSQTIGVSSKALILEAGEVSSKYEATWTTSNVESNSLSWDDDVSVTLQIQLAVPKYTKSDFKVQYFEGTTPKLPFDGITHFVLDNNASFETPIKGYYQGVSSTKATVDTTIIAKYDTEHNKWVPIDSNKVENVRKIFSPEIIKTVKPKK